MDRGANTSGSEMDEPKHWSPPSEGVDSNAPTDVSEDINENLQEKKDEAPAGQSQQPQQAPAPNGAAAWQSNAPDGGVRAWLVVFGAACISFCTFGWLNSVGVFQQYYQETILRQYSAGTVSWIPSLQIFFMMSTGPFIGMIYDKHGTRWILIVGSVMHVFGLMMASLSKEYYQVLLSQGVCSAIGVGCLYLPAMNVIPSWFNKKRGAAYGALAVGSSFGGIIFPIMLSHIISRLGFGWAMRISAFMIMGLLIIANITIRPYTPPKARPVTLERVIKPWTEVPFLLLAAGLVLFTFGMYVPIDYIPDEAAAAGMSPDLVQYLVPILNAGSVFGRLGSGLLSDRVGRYNIFTTVCYLAGIFTLALWIPASTDGARIAFAALFGFLTGAYVALIGALVVQISPPQEIGFRTGLAFAACSIPGLVTSPVSGAILSSSHGWMDPKIFAGVCALVGSTFILATRLYQTKMKLAVVY